jgi:hypothetical protein
VHREGGLTVRTVFVGLLLFIAAGLAYCISIGVMSR